MNPLIPVLTLRAVGTRFSIDLNVASCRCWAICPPANQPSLVRLTMKSARLLPFGPANWDAIRRESTSSKQIAGTNRHPAGPIEGPVVGAVAGVAGGDKEKTVS